MGPPSIDPQRDPARPLPGWVVGALLSAAAGTWVVFELVSRWVAQR